MIRQGRHQCPCCDHYTLQERGSYQSCPVCYWEDDGSDLAEVDRPSRANHKTLRQARANFARFGACDQAAVSLVASPAERAGLRREVRSTP